MPSQKTAPVGAGDGMARSSATPRQLRFLGHAIPATFLGHW